MEEIEMPIDIPEDERNAQDNLRIRRKLFFLVLAKLIETDDFETNFKNTGRWLCLHQAVSSVLFDLDFGTTRNTFQSVFFCGAVLLGGKLGNFAGKSLGNLYSSVAGKWSGILFGMIFGVICGAKTEDVVSNIADEYEYDMELRNCETCGAPFTHRRYEHGWLYYCGNCRQNPGPILQF
ncbi:unnamed protein product [Caenorhabditis brenneri]